MRPTRASDLHPMAVEVTPRVTPLQAGDAVNLEVDVLAKYVERLLQAQSDEQAWTATKSTTETDTEGAS